VWRLCLLTATCWALLLSRPVNQLTGVATFMLNKARIISSTHALSETPRVRIATWGVASRVNKENKLFRAMSLG